MSTTRRPLNTPRYGKLRKHIPFFVFLAFYLLTCFVGAALILGNYRPYVELLVSFSGNMPPQLTQEQLLTNLLLLIASPVLMYVGYIAGLLASNHVVFPTRSRRSSVQPSTGLVSTTANITFYLLAAIAVVDIYAANAFENFETWLNYGFWIEARYRLFASLSFLSFVNIYVLVPVAAAWVLVARDPETKVQRVLRWLPAIIATLIGLLVFQKRVVIVDLLLIGTAWALWRISNTRTKNLGKLVLLGGVAITVTYFGLVVLPVYSHTAKTIAEALNITDPYASVEHPAPRSQHTTVGASSETPTRKEETSPTPSPSSVDTKTKSTRSHAAQPTRRKLITIWRSLNLNDRQTRILLYAIMAPLSRTSVPALYYPVVFPKHHPFYGLYYGQNFFDLGDVPNDNVVVWDYMNPKIPGATAAPFQYALYSQVGLAGALIGSLIVGFGLAFLWNLIQSGGMIEPWRSLMGALVILAAFYLALDSLHNEIIASYGVSWGVLFVLLAWGSVLGVNRAGLRLRRRNEQP